MAMETEIKATIVAWVDKKSFWDWINYARDTGKKLDAELKRKLELDIASFQVQLDQAKARLKQAKKEWDRDAIIKAQVDTNQIQSWLTEAKRQLNNYVNTWDKDLSRLQAKFNATNETIRTQSTLFWWLLSKAKTAILWIWGLVAGAFAISKIVWFFKSIVQEAKDWQRAVAQMNAVIQSTWGTVWYTWKQLADMAKELAKVNAIEDDVIMASQNMLLTFTQIKWDTFNKATQAVIDLSTAMNWWLTPSAEELSKTSIQVGKALNDPLKWIGALRKVWVTFSEEQVKLITNFQKTWEVAKAQWIIIAELNKEFGGSAQAQLDTYWWKVQQLSVDWANFKETLWNIVLPVLSMVMDWFTKMIWWVEKFINMIRPANEEVSWLWYELQKLKEDTDAIWDIKEETLEKIYRLNKAFTDWKISIEEYTKKSKDLNAQMYVLADEEAKLADAQDKLNFLQEKWTSTSDAYVKKQKEVSDENKNLFDKQIDLKEAFDKWQISQSEYTNWMIEYKKAIWENNSELQRLWKQQKSTATLTDILANSTLSATEAKDLFNKLQTNTGKSRDELSKEQAQVKALSMEYIRNLQIKQQALAIDIKKQAKRWSFIDAIFGTDIVWKADKRIEEEMKPITQAIIDVQELMSAPIDVGFAWWASSAIKDLWDATDDTWKSADAMKKSFEDAFDSIDKDIDWSAKKINDLQWEIDKLSWALDSFNKDIASRVADIDTLLAKSWEDAVSSEERAKLEAERAEAFVWLTKEQTDALQKKIDAQKEYNDMTEIGKLKKDFEEQTWFTPEKAQIEIETKKKNLELEQVYRQALTDARIQMDKDYSKKYWESINKNIAKNNELIISYNKVADAAKAAFLAMQLKDTWDNARANWWPVSAWSPYIVWEKWPELFVPQNSWKIIPNNQMTNNININANVSNDIELDALANALAKKIALSRKGIF